MQDALLPVSGGSREQFSGWAATLVDSLDTLWIMGLRDEFDEAVEAACQIDFGRVDQPEGQHTCGREEALLQKAVELGDLIYAAFNTPNGMPVDFIDFAAAKAGEAGNPSRGSCPPRRHPVPGDDAALPDHGGRKVLRRGVPGMDLFCKGQNGLTPRRVAHVGVDEGREDVVSGGAFTLGGGAGLSVRVPPQDAPAPPRGDDKYRAMAGAFLDAADRHFVFRPMTPPPRTILLPGNVNVVDGKAVLDPETEHLALLVRRHVRVAGRLLNRTDYLDSGIRLTTAASLWDHERRRRAPEWKPHLPEGFTTAKDPRYILRPEAIESVFYMYRITGDEAFQDKAWDMFTAISNGTRTEYAKRAVWMSPLRAIPCPRWTHGGES
ncbi:hypothetical protein J3459_014980 [Metarhizium acridum]|nr:hypothetical protein J3459_014980 [Metarhizium acridum]